MAARKPASSSTTSQSSPPTSNAELAATARRIRELLGTWTQSDVLGRVRIGEELATMRARLAHGQWLGWVDAALPFTSRQAGNLIELFTFSVEHPATFRTLAPLGPSKLYVLMRLAPTRRSGLLKRRRHQVPSTGLHKPLEELSVSEFMEVIRASADDPPSPIDNLMSTSQSKITAAIHALGDLAEHRDDLDPDFLEDMHDRLSAALESYAADVGLED